MDRETVAVTPGPVRVLAHFIPGDRVLLVGETMLENEWLGPGRLAGWLPAERYFPA